MSRRPRRLAALVLSILLGATLVACGNNDSSDSSKADPLSAVTIKGAPSKAPEVTWNHKLTADGIQTTVITKGDGPTVASGDQVVANIWIGNGVDEKQVYSTYQQGQPQTVTVDDSLSPVFKDALEGQTIGSRVAVTAPAQDAFGEAGNTQLGIGNEDSVLIIVDLVKKQVVLDGPQGAKRKAPAWAPTVVQKGTQVTGLDFRGTPKPDGKLRSAVLVQGTGAAVKKGQTITVNYLGQVYGAKQPFDESYSKSPASFPIGVGQVVPGWDKTLVGAKVGSRLILEIPPKDGYGSQGQPSAGIKGTDTMYFVVDILGVS